MSGSTSDQPYLDWLGERVAHYLGGPVDPDAPLAEYGLDSAAALSLYGDIEERLGPVIEPADIWDFPTVRSLAGFLAVREELAERDGGVRAAFVFTGQGSQHPGMTAGLYTQSTVYRRHLDEISEVLLPWTGLSVVELIMDGDPRIHRAAFAQPAVFAVGYALAATLAEAGVRPVAVLGHGMGEFAAAAVAGAISPRDAAQLVALRGAFMQYLPRGGGMLATCLSPHESAEAAAGEPGVVVAAINATRATVLSGEAAALQRVAERLAARGVRTRTLPVEHAYHSPLMSPVRSKFEAAARRVSGGMPGVPYYSTVHGRSTSEPLYASYWSEQTTAPIRFAEAIRNLLDQQTPTHVVEIGPKAVLTPYVRRAQGRCRPVCLPMCRGPETNAVDLAGTFSALGAGPLTTALAEA
ncbi:hypothetical protein BFF78_19305 [Streptomyces fodineus]|uniref:Carrier domain-containing protein n=1 Tax=Streptomyces fodineus TaxID=1904616 RepID=A0A1D7YBN5_9ACTN|nr:acyltransferase domain-containing protein [Streptomyces fodineus]AOR32924.1 hypothetical protein BFF78_19305 [Streptomyces fodineus]